MKQIYAVIMILFAFFNDSNAFTSFMKSGHSSVDFGVSYATSSSYYDIDGKKIIYTKDTFNILINGITPYSYNLKRTFELIRYTIYPGLSYALNDDMLLSVQVPLSLISLDEKYELDTNSRSPTRGMQTKITDFSMFIPEFYRINFDYRLMKGLYNPSIKASIIAPPSLSNGVQNSDTTDYQYYSAYKFYLGMVNYLKFEKSFIWLETGYLYRTGDFNSCIFTRLDAGFSTVENTSLYGFLLYYQNLGDMKTTRPVIPTATTLAETSLELGAGFRAMINKKIMIDFNYQVPMGMTNTISESRFSLNSSFLFD